MSEELLDEVAKSIGDASHLALYISQNNETTFALYDPNILENMIIDGFASRSNKLLMTIGTIAAKKSNNYKHTWIVTGSAAVQGYGPLMYDILMSYIKPDFLRSDLSSVSKAAKKIWNHNLTLRANEYEVKPSPAPLHQNEPALNHAFAIKNPIDYKSLVENHNKTIEYLMKTYSYPIEDLQQIITSSETEFFNEKYRTREK